MSKHPVDAWADVVETCAKILLLICHDALRCYAICHEIMRRHARTSDHPSCIPKTELDPQTLAPQKQNLNKEPLNQLPRHPPPSPSPFAPVRGHNCSSERFKLRCPCRQYSIHQVCSCVVPNCGLLTWDIPSLNQGPRVSKAERVTWLRKPRRVEVKHQQSPRKICCAVACRGMPRHASSRRWGVPEFSKSYKSGKTQNQTQKTASPDTLQR